MYPRIQLYRVGAGGLIGRGRIGVLEPDAPRVFGMDTDARNGLGRNDWGLYWSVAARHIETSGLILS